MCNTHLAALSATRRIRHENGNWVTQDNAPKCGSFQPKVITNDCQVVITPSPWFYKSPFTAAVLPATPLLETLETKTKDGSISNYSLVEQPIDILIKKLTKLSIIDISINSWSKYQIWQKYQIWPKFQKLTTMSTVDKNVKFDKNIKFDQNINLTKMSNLRCTFSKMYLPLPHLLPFDYLGDSSVLDRKEIFPSLILFCVSWNLVIGHQGLGGTDETNVFTVLVLKKCVCVGGGSPTVPTAFLSTNRIYALLSHFSLPKIVIFTLLLSNVRSQFAFTTLSSSPEFQDWRVGVGRLSQPWQCYDFESIGYISFFLTWVWWKQWNGGRRSWGQAWGQSSPSSEGLPCEPKTACHPYMPRRHKKGIFLSDLYLQLT